MVAQDGATPLITWDPELTGGVGVPLSQIVAGDYDTYIQAQAEAAASWHRTIYVRFGQEMNLSGSPFGPGVNGNTPQLFIEAWRHVVRIFRTAGATNVKWVWSPNVDCAGKCPFKAFYPGDSWVDWVGLDGYNYAAVDDVPWMSFETIFQSSYNQLSALTSKPIMIAETASTTLGGNKAAWITKALTQTLPTEMPLVRALVWFDVDKETNWTVNSSPASLNAFRAAVDQPLFSGTLAG
jgi:beta-mannanase